MPSFCDFFSFCFEFFWFFFFHFFNGIFQLFFIFINHFDIWNFGIFFGTFHIHGNVSDFAENFLFWSWNYPIRQNDPRSVLNGQCRAHPWHPTRLSMLLVGGLWGISIHFIHELTVILLYDFLTSSSIISLRMSLTSAGQHHSMDTACRGPSTQSKDRRYGEGMHVPSTLHLGMSSAKCICKAAGEIASSTGTHANNAGRKCHGGQWECQWQGHKPRGNTSSTPATKTSRCNMRHWQHDGATNARHANQQHNIHHEKQTHSTVLHSPS